MQAHNATSRIPADLSSCVTPTTDFALLLFLTTSTQSLTIPICHHHTDHRFLASCLCFLATWPFWLPFTLSIPSVVFVLSQFLAPLSAPHHYNNGTLQNKQDRHPVGR